MSESVTIIKKEDSEMRNLITQVNSILDQYGISDGQLAERLGKKYSKNTIKNFRHMESSNPNLETFVDICTAAGIRVRLETDASAAAEVSDSVEEYRVMMAELRAANAELLEDKKKLAEQNAALSEAINRVTTTNENLSNSLLKSNTRFDKLAEKYNLF